MLLRILLHIVFFYHSFESRTGDCHKARFEAARCLGDWTHASCEFSCKRSVFSAD